MELKVGNIVMFRKSKNIAIVIDLDGSKAKMKYLIVVNEEDMAATIKTGLFYIDTEYENFDLLSDINNLSKLEKLVYGVGL